MDGLAVKLGIHGMVAPPPISSAAVEVRVNPTQVSAIGRSTAERSASPPGPRFSFRYPLTSLWRGGGNQRHGGLEAAAEVAVDGGGERGATEEGIGSVEGQNGNWVAKILQLNSIWRDRQRKKGVEEEAVDDRCGGGGEGEEGCEICGAEDEEQIEFDRDSFSRLLRRVSLTDAKLYAQMSYLGNLAYSIPTIKPRNLLKYRGLRFVTSSIEKKELAAKADKELAEKDHPLAKIQEPKKTKEVEEEGEEEKRERYQISALAAYKIAASAASYLHSQTKSMLPFKSKDGEGSSARGYENADRMMLTSAEVASLKATTDSMTAVVAAKEEEKQAVANNLNSTRSTPCEWFICDNDQTATRFFVIQGSESLESWQANLLFEPVQFEGLGVLVHRGIYEAAKGIYEQMLPEVRAHLKSHGKRATVRFTGHSLGGSLSLLINLMLLIRGEVPLSSLLPVVTFGAPSIMCGGDRLLQKLGLPRSHVQAITLHRDIVPRAFSCSYPNHIVELLKAMNGNFRNHPCLDKQNLLYAPMGELLILQPDEKMSPHHHLLPSGSGMFLLSCALSDLSGAERQVQAAKMVFLNSPHPLEILSDRSAYGSEGTIQRDHDMNSYYKSVRHVIREELRGIRKAERAQRREVWWPLVNLNRFNAGVILGRQVSTVNLSGALRTGRETLTRFGRYAASQQMHLFVVLLFPVRLLLLGAYNVFNFS